MRTTGTVLPLSLLFNITAPCYKHEPLSKLISTRLDSYYVQCFMLPEIPYTWSLDSDFNHNGINGGPGVWDRPVLYYTFSICLRLYITTYVKHTTITHLYEDRRIIYNTFSMFLRLCIRTCVKHTTITHLYKDRPIIYNTCLVGYLGNCWFLIN